MAFGNFESASPSKKEKQENQQEDIPSSSSQWEQAKRFTKIAAVIGYTSFLSVLAHENYQDNQEYDAHLDELLDTGKKEHLDSLYSEIREGVGEDAVRNIQHGDKVAYLSWDDLDEDQPVSYEGFEALGTSNEGVGKVLSKDFFFPKNWIQGEMKKVAYIDEVKEVGYGRGVAKHSDREKAVIFYRKQEAELSEQDKRLLPWFLKYYFSHEVGHANDWETDKDLNIIERAELLTSVIDRMESDDAYESDEARRGRGEYYRTYLDGTKGGKYTAAKEYWAEICRAYFTMPTQLKEEFPRDFALVDKYVAKQDSEFNVFEVGGPYFGGRTGELLPKWQRYIEENM